MTELLTFYAKLGEQLRRKAAQFVRGAFRSQDIEVIPQTHISFLMGLDLYEQRPDKGYSLADCISMQSMRQRGLLEVLTNDKHFRQEGFTILLTPP
ncbi:MAG: hypothetical protein AAGF24_08575 [Cyanobacteria bacterium P01_H01_bin.121]